MSGKKVIAVLISDELLDEVARAIIIQTSGPILLAKRFPVPGDDRVVTLGGESQLSCARAIAINVLQLLTKITERNQNI